jgi:L-lactate dehydrogenase (cytochrome)
VLSDEIETTMRLLGVTSLDELTVHHVNSRELEQAIVKESSFADSNAQVKARL